MTPDREIDRLIAEKVMELDVFSNDSYRDRGIFHAILSIPHYSTSPRDSRLLRDKLAETWHWQMHSPFGSVPFYSVGLWPKGEEFVDFSFIGHGDTEESAVIDAVREWLKSKGIEVPCGK